MLPPKYLAGLPEPILELWKEAELAVLKDMARRISTYDFWIPAADFQNEKLLEAGRTQEDILAVLAKTTERSVQELREMMVEAGSRSLRDDVAVYTAAGLQPPRIPDSKELSAILNDGYRATAQTMKNLTRTTARTAARQFEDALDNAWLQVSSGTFDADSAIRSAVKQLSREGIQAIEYPTGHADTAETAVRRAILTGVNQTAARLQEELADEVGCDLVEVSAHAGARPEHALWQGKIYSRSGRDPKYPSLREATGYGTVTGLCGVNCRHTMGAYIEGSPRVWSDEKLAELSAPKYEYRGEKFTEYEARQKEQYFDRQIHRWNREAEAMKAAGQDPSEAQAKVKSWKTRKADFVLNRAELPVANISNRDILNAEGNLAKAIDSFLLVDDTDEHRYTPAAILEEMQKSPVGLKTIRNIRDSEAVIEIVDEPQINDIRGDQRGNNIRIYSTNIKNRRVAGQTVIHEMTHYTYQIGRCQHAEAVCFAMEKMHILGRDYLTSGEWEQMVNLAIQAYPEYKWEEGGYGDFTQFNFVVE